MNFRKCCREVDTAARMGGDEFALVLPAVSDPNGASLVANRLIFALGEPIAVDGDSCSVGASVGIALYPRDGQTTEALIRAADAAMYASKASGGNCSNALSLAHASRGSSMMVTVGFLHEWLLRHVDSADRELARQLLARGYSEGGWSGDRSIRAPH
jgi:predicted signal transduction protein with EAL and GGDEF domain